MTPDAPWAGLAVATGAGLLIGLERERRKGRGPGREAAGIRTFTLAAVAGALAALVDRGLGWPVAAALAGAAVVALAAVSHWRSARGDPGMTTELALVVTCLIGMLAPGQPVLAAGAAAGVALLLAARGRLHALATRVLTEAELHDALVLAALLLVALPLAPAEPLPWLAGMTPHGLLGLVVLLLALQAAGHAALRLAGPRLGLMLSGLCSGFVSSTATVAAMGARSRDSPALAPAARAGAVASSAATWVQAALLLAALHRPTAALWLPVAAAGAAAAAAAAWAMAGGRSARAESGAGEPGTRRAGAGRADPGATAAARPGSMPGRPATQRVLRWREAMIVAALLAGVTLLVSWAQTHHGAAGAWAGAMLAALADAHAGVAALGALAADARLPPERAVLGAWLAIAVNTVVRMAVAAMAGGPRFAAPVAAGLLAGLGAAAAAGAMTGAFMPAPR